MKKVKLVWWKTEKQKSVRREAGAWCYWHHHVSNWWLKLAGGESGPKAKHPSKPCTSAKGFDFSSIQSKEYFLSHCSPALLFSSLFTLLHLGVPQAKQHLPGQLCSSFCCTFCFRGLGSSQPCPASDCFFWGFFGQLSSHKRAIFNSSLQGTGEKQTFFGIIREWCLQLHKTFGVVFIILT